MSSVSARMSGLESVTGSMTRATARAILRAAGSAVSPVVACALVAALVTSFAAGAAAAGGPAAPGGTSGEAMATSADAAGAPGVPGAAGAAGAAQAVDKPSGGETVTVQVGAGKDGFYLKTTDGNFLIKLRALVQFDGRFYADDTTPDNIDTFLLRRARPILEGTVFQKFDFLFVPDFGQGRTVIQDAYLDSRFLPEFQVRAGKFKTPFSLERLQSDAAAVFLEKSLPANLAPDRDLGLVAHGDFAGGALNYAAGVMNGVADGATGDTDINDSKEVVARVFWVPFKKSEGKALKGLGVGIAATWGTNVGTATTPGLAPYRTFGQQPFFAFKGDGKEGTTVVGDGSRERLAPQAYYYYGRLGVLGEYVSSKQEVALADATERLKNTGWNLGASFLLTNDQAALGGVSPKRPFGQGGAGAFEVAVRYGTLTIDDKAFPVFADPAKSASEAVEWEAGVNWYLNRAVRFSLDGGLTSFKGGAVNGEDREDEKVLITRFQLNF